MKGKTSSGFAFTVDEEIKDDMELLENLCALDKGDLTALPGIVENILGADQKKKLYDYCRGKSGGVSSAKVMAEIKGIFDAISEGTNEALKN